jgi:DNA-binding sugar fermentation-stimulating protein
MISVSLLTDFLIEYSVYLRGWESPSLVGFIKLEVRTLWGIFQKRPNRFLAFIGVEDRLLSSFLPNLGRIHGLLILGTEVVLIEVVKENRKTVYDLIGVVYNGQMVSVDSRVPKNAHMSHMFTPSISAPQ